ncbi:hypothetical protein GIB67_035780 [Kingdonia uniflora]|uniref:WAT1-related protein n=1 Tax=Kingdonia uniflora TaxID=39325 RepID=A0A7J7MJG4_9MAGN|nr:hypothetical protein GIB67_035780 [Kingdonia uniflora]
MTCKVIFYTLLRSDNPFHYICYCCLCWVRESGFQKLEKHGKGSRHHHCVGGGMSMALLKGQKLLNINLVPQNSVFGSGGEDWLLGSLFLFGRCCCWSLWLILQVPMAACHPDHLSLSAWLCFFATLQSAIFAFLFESDLKAWNLHSSYEVLSCFYSGIIGSAVSFFALAWCISKRGPLFSAMFNPLSTVIVTILACILLHEELYTGSLAGSFAVVGGLYVVLWGKSKDIKETKIEANYNDDETGLIKALIDESSEKTCKVDFQEPLLNMKCSDIC